MRLTIVQMLLLFGYSAIMSLGQIAFKYLARDLGQPTSFWSTATSLPSLPLFWVVGFLYLSATMLWIWLLTKIPLSIAYPFQSTALIIVPLLTWLLFDESLSLQYWIGIGLIVGGIALVVR